MSASVEDEYVDVLLVAACKSCNRKLLPQHFAQHHGSSKYSKIALKISLKNRLMKRCDDVTVYLKRWLLSYN